VVGCCESGDETSGSIKCGISWLYKGMLTFGERMCSMDWFFSKLVS